VNTINIRVAENMSDFLTEWL